MLDWEERALGGGVTAEIGTTGGISRVSGTARSEGGAVEWSAIRKVLVDDERPWVDDLVLPRHDPRGFEYWRREAEWYADAALADLGPRLEMPRCLAIDDHDDRIELWLDEMADVGPATWDMAEYHDASSALGDWAGRWLAEPTLPDRPWFTRSRIPSWLDLGAPGIARLASDERTGLCAAWFDADTLERLLALWARRGELLAVRSQLPVTLCHHDATRRNLGFRGTGDDRSLVAIDWQFVGRGHLGDEPAAMVTATLQFLDVAMDDAAAFRRSAIDGYTDGLASVGWDGDPRLVELGFDTSAALLMALGGAGMWFAGFASGLMTDEIAETIVGRPADEIGAAWARLWSDLLDLGDAALAAAPSILPDPR